MSERYVVKEVCEGQVCVYDTVEDEGFVWFEDGSDTWREKADRCAAALNAAEHNAKREELLREAVDIANNAWEHVTYSTVAREMKDPPRLELSIEHGKETGRRIRNLLARFDALQKEGKDETKTN